MAGTIDDSTINIVVVIIIIIIINPCTLPDERKNTVVDAM